METEPRTQISLSEIVAKEIRILLVRRDWKQSDLATRMGKSEMWVSRRLRGAQPIDLNDLQLFAEALNVEAADLLPRPDEGRTVSTVGGQAGGVTSNARSSRRHRRTPAAAGRATVKRLSRHQPPDVRPQPGPAGPQPSVPPTHRRPVLVGASS